MSDPFALFISWTCYGNWLPGDPRGYVSNTRQVDGSYERKHNEPGKPYSADDADTLKRAQALQKWPTVRLTRQEAAVAAQSLVEAASSRGWHIIRGAVMANHVHVVVCDCPDDGPAVRRVLKGRSQAALSKAAGQPRKWWTEGGSDRCRRGVQSIEATVKYVADQPFMLVEIVDMQVRVVAIGESPG